MSASLPKPKIEQIRQLAAQGERIMDIARTMGLDRGTVSRYLHAETREPTVKRAPAAALTQDEVDFLKWQYRAFTEVECPDCETKLGWLPPNAYVVCAACRNVWLVMRGKQPKHAGHFDG